MSWCGGDTVPTAPAFWREPARRRSSRVRPPWPSTEGHPRFAACSRKKCGSRRLRGGAHDARSGRGPGGGQRTIGSRLAPASAENPERRRSGGTTGFRGGRRTPSVAPTACPAPLAILIARSHRMSTPPRGSTLVAITKRATRAPRHRDASCNVPREEAVDHYDDKTQPLPTSAGSGGNRLGAAASFPPLSGAHTGCPLGAQTPGNRREFPACR
jgi:hypothetical protein